MIPTKEILLYCGLVYFFTFFFDLLCLQLGNPTVFSFPLINYQAVIPGFLAFVFLRLKKENMLKIGFGVTRPLILFVSLVLPILIPFAAFLIVGGWRVNVPWLFQLRSFFGHEFLKTAPAIFLFALGEEFGWRGYLLNRLRPLGLHLAILIVGMVWTFWHWILYSAVYPMENLWLEFFLIYLPTVLSLSFVLALLYFASSTLWAPVLFHLIYNVRVQMLGLADVLADVQSFRICEAALWVLTGMICFILLNRLFIKRGG